MSSNRKPVEALAGSVRRIRDELEANAAATSPKSSPDADADAATSDPGTYPPSQDARPPPADSTNGAHDAPASLLAPVNIGAPSLTDGAEAATEGALGTAQAAEAGPAIVRRRGREPGSMENLDAGPTRTPPPERSGDAAGGEDGGAPVLAPNQKPQLKPKPMPKPKLQPIRALSTIAAELIREASQPGLGRGPEPGPGAEASDNRKSTKPPSSSDKPTSASKSGYQRTTSKVSTSSKSGPEPEVPLLPPPPSRVEQQQQQQRKQSANKKTITESDTMPIDVEPGPQVRGPTRPPKPPEKRLLKQRPHEPEPAPNDEQNNLNAQQQHSSGPNAGPLEGQEAGSANTAGGSSGLPSGTDTGRSLSRTVQPQVELLDSGKPKRRMSIPNRSDKLYQFIKLYVKIRVL